MQPDSGHFRSHQRVRASPQCIRCLAHEHAPPADQATVSRALAQAVSPLRRQASVPSTSRTAASRRRQRRCDTHQRGVTADEPPQVIAQPSEAPFDGLLTNDKFCVTRRAVVPLSWSRQPLRLRNVSLVSLQSRGTVQAAGGTDETHTHVEHPTPADPAPRCTDPLGSRLSAPAAVDGQLRGGPRGSSRLSAGGL
jgi:hypothetical protein